MQCREVQNRMNMTADERRNNMPYTGDENTVFADSDESYSIVNIKGKNGDYGEGVLLDTNIFDGKKPREWNKVLTEFVYDNLAGTEMTVRDENGNEEVISFAKRNERVQKDGATNSHKVIDKLARAKGNTNSLGIVHIDELLQTAEKFALNQDNSHQWLDKNGWDIRKAYMQDRNGNIYETLLNISKSKDGRKILYALSNTKKVDDGVVSSTRNREGLAHNDQLSDNSIPQNPDVVNTNSEKNVPPQSAEPTAPPKVEPKVDVQERRTEKFDLQDTKITRDMDDNKRAEVLRNKSINVVEFNAERAEKLDGIDLDRLQKSLIKYAKPIIKKVAEDFGVFDSTYSNADIELEFEYSKSSLKESINKQQTQYGDFIKMLSVFPEVVRNAVGVETHTDKYRGTIREDTNLKQMYVLTSAFNDNGNIIPVKLEVKEFNQETNKLYMTVVLSKKENRDLHGNLDYDNQLNAATPASDISISDLVRNVNPSEGDFLKYFPDSMLDNEQIEGKKAALAKDAEKYNTLKSGRRYDLQDRIIWGRTFFGIFSKKAGQIKKISYNVCIN